MKKIFNSQILIIITALVLIGSFGTLAQDVSSGKIPQVYLDKLQGQKTLRDKAVQNNYGDMLATLGKTFGAQTGNLENVSLPGGVISALAAWGGATAYVSGMTYNSGTGLYYIVDVGDSVWTWDGTATAPTLLDVISPALGPNGIAYNPNDGLYYLCTGTELYTYALGSSTATLVGAFGTGGLMIDICFDFTGTCYGYDVGTDMAYTINTGTGVATALGSLGFNANFGQGMGYDFETGQIYLTAFDGTAFDGQLRVMDPESGYTNILASFGLNQKDPFAPVSTLAALPGPGRATGPSPANGATGVPLVVDTDLMWTNAGSATSIEVFFGTDPLALSSIYSGAPITTTSVTTNYSTQYFWRVDQTSGAGTTQGTLWSFTTEALPCPVVDIPVTEDFEGSATVFPPLCWSVDGTSTLWDYGDLGAPNGISAVALFYDVFSGYEDLISLEYNSTTATTPLLTFDWAYAIYPGSTDHLEIYESTDGGLTWTLLADMYNGAPGDDELNPFGLSTTSGYFPAANEWSTRSIALSPNTTNVKFSAVTDFGNYCWLDNIQITGELFEDNFDSYTAGVQLAGQSPDWETWSQTTGGPDDPFVSNAQSYSNPNSVVIVADNDLVHQFGPKTSGKWYISFLFYIPSGKSGYFNTMNQFVPPSTFQWGMDAFFDVGGTGRLDTDGAGGGGNIVNFSWEQDNWNQVMVIVDLNTSVAEFYLSQCGSLVQVASWDWTHGGVDLNELACNDFYGGAATDEMYVDNYYFSDASPPIAALSDDVGAIAVDMPTQVAPGTVVPMATVKNFGIATNTFDVTMTITGGYTSTKTVTDLAPDATEQVIFDNFAAATGGPLTVEVCTELGTDQCLLNDCTSQILYVWDDSAVWSTGNVLPQTNFLGSGCSSNGHVYSIGGVTASGLGTECYDYDVSANTWTAITPLPAGRDRNMSAIIGGYIYAIGGYDAVAGTQTNTVYRYDISGGGAWTTMSNLPTPLGWAKAAGYNDGTNDYIYVAGGFDAVGGTLRDDVFLYNVAANTWTAATSMPGQVYGGGFAIVGNKLVYIGGGSGTVYVGTIDAGNPAVIVWTASDAPNPLIENKGFSASFDKSGENNSLLRTRKIQLGDNVPFPPGEVYRTDAAPWGSDGVIITTGNSGGFPPSVPNPCYVYNVTGDSWTAFENLPTPVIGSSMGSVNDGSTWKLIVAGGDTDSPSNPTDATQILTQTIGGSTFAFNVSVADGWNMVSVPGLNPVNQNVETWWSGKDPGAGVFKYAGGYVQVTVATPTEGYWMKNSGAQTYNYSGIQVVPHNDVPLALGWNLIGLYENTVSVPLTTTPPGIITTGIFEYNGGYQTATSLVPGFAYWVKADAAGSITGLSAPPLGKEGGEIAEYFKEDWGKIILTDASGTNYTLYAVNGEVDLNKYELPPLPPSGVFDIRYGSGRIAEDLTSSQSIELSGVQYPLTVRVENMTLALQDATGRELNSNLNPGQEFTITDKSLSKLIVLSDGMSLPTEYALEQNYPNPFNPSTTIKFALPEAANVTLSIYNTLGEKVAEVVNSRLEAGRYSYQWNAGAIATGMYIYELRTDNFVSVKKMLLLK